MYSFTDAELPQHNSNSQFSNSRLTTHTFYTVLSFIQTSAKRDNTKKEANAFNLRLEL
jgi:hypothetical protein